MLPIMTLGQELGCIEDRLHECHLNLSETLKIVLCHALRHLERDFVRVLRIGWR